MVLWGVVVAILFGSVFKLGILGTIGGFFMGLLIHQFIQSQKTRQLGRYNFLVIYEVLAYLNKAKGNISTQDIEYALSIMKLMRLSGKMQIRAKKSFNFGKSPNYRLYQRVRAFYSSYGAKPELIHFFLRVQIEALLRDRTRYTERYAILASIAKELNVSDSELELIVEDVQQGNNYNYYNKPMYGAVSSPLKEAYDLLNVKHTDDEKSIKRAYLRLMNKYHPDKLAAKEVNQEIVDLAKQKTQQIQEAYDLIRREHGF